MSYLDSGSRSSLCVAGARKQPLRLATNQPKRTDEGTSLRLWRQVGRFARECEQVTPTRRQIDPVAARPNSWARCSVSCAGQFSPIPTFVSPPARHKQQTCPVCQFAATCNRPSAQSKLLLAANCCHNFHTSSRKANCLHFCPLKSRCKGANFVCSSSRVGDKLSLKTRARLCNGHKYKYPPSQVYQH